MGKKKIEISNFGLEISRAIRSEMGIRRLSEESWPSPLAEVRHMYANVSPTIKNGH